ncbi:MAG: OadG family protein [Syntrophobacter sp.]
MSSIGIGLQLTVFGMGLVFLLLAVMALLIKLLLRTDSTPPVTVPPEEKEPAPAPPPYFDADSLAAILVAVIAHRDVCRKRAATATRRSRPDTAQSRWVTVGRSHNITSWQPGRRTR